MQRYSVQFRNTILQKLIGPEKRKAAGLSKDAIATVCYSLEVCGYQSL